MAIEDERKTDEPSLESDRVWLEAFRRGERGALTRVYRAHSQAVARLLSGGFSFSSGGRDCRFRGAQNTFDLEDRVQETFSKAFTESARLNYDGVSPYRAYILRIARNLVIDEFRRKERVMVSFEWTLPDTESARNQGSSEPLAGWFDRVGHPERDAEASQLMAVVKAVVGGLNERERWVYQHRFIEHLEHAEISAMTGLSPSKIKTSEQRIRRAFYERLRNEGYLEGWEKDKKGWLQAAFRSLKGTR